MNIRKENETIESKRPTAEIKGGFLHAHARANIRIVNNLFSIYPPKPLLQDGGRYFKVVTLKILYSCGYPK